MSDEGIPRDDLAEQIAMEQEGESREELETPDEPTIGDFYDYVKANGPTTVAFAGQRWTFRVPDVAPPKPIDEEGGQGNG